jgi:N-acyl homoserine lactone hydrolase
VKRKIGLAAILLSAALSVDVSHAQMGKPGVERLYILNCGEGVAGDISRWSPGVNEGKSMEFVDTCYLIKHSQGWFLWDTGITDAVAAMPDGLAPADPKAVFWRRPKTAGSSA